MQEIFVLTGVVCIGNKLGRTIGFPTANLLTVKENTIPLKNGVYAVRVGVRGKIYDGMANIGVRPTLDRHDFTVEANLFDFSEDIYGETIKIFFYDYIRGERKFSGLEELKSQLLKDKITVKKILSDRMQPNPNPQ